MNKVKGDTYEKYIKQHIYIKYPNSNVWLWNDIPEYNLREAGI